MNAENIFAIVIHLDISKLLPFPTKKSLNSANNYSLKIVVVPDGETAKKGPSIDGLLEYRKDNKQLYVRTNEAWSAVAQEEKVLLRLYSKRSLTLTLIECDRNCVAADQ